METYEMPLLKLLIPDMTHTIYLLNSFIKINVKGAQNSSFEFNKTIDIKKDVDGFKGVLTVWGPSDQLFANYLIMNDLISIYKTESKISDQFDESQEDVYYFKLTRNALLQLL